MARTRLTLPVCLAVLSASCHDTPTAAYAPLPVCPRTIAVTVSPGLEPDISWSPQCGISSLSVTTLPGGPADYGTVMWSAYVNETSPFGPNIRYGRAPVGASTQSPLALKAGTRYRIWLYQTVGQDGITSEGITEFTP
jgi:hypothetical protein